jgi:hypothetical protein
LRSAFASPICRDQAGCSAVAIVSHDKKIKGVRADWTEVVLVCRKCSRKLDGGFGDKGEDRLAKSLRKELGGKGKGRKARFAVIEVDCLDICPKDAVMVVRAAAPKEWAVVPKGTPAASVVERLGLAKPDEDER